ncbi:MAG TPA: hypothetical protein VFC94_03610 [Bacteroidaceae bacterium]|nr:hypothetical protein [Bacteroidaceae bacterium]
MKNLIEVLQIVQICINNYKNGTKKGVDIWHGMGYMVWCIVCMGYMVWCIVCMGLWYGYME